MLIAFKVAGISDNQLPFSFTASARTFRITDKAQSTILRFRFTAVAGFYFRLFEFLDVAPLIKMIFPQQ